MEKLKGTLLSIAGFRPGSRHGSNIRRFLSRFTLVISAVILLELLFPFRNFDFSTLHPLTTRIAVLWSVVYFTVVVVIPVIFLTSRDFRLDPQRLFWNILLSGTYCILAFGLLYRSIGLADSVEGMQLRMAGDAYYFSAVTFSTLGFGDFRPVAAARGYAALQGIWGNIHLGILAGAVFYAITANGSLSEEVDRHSKE